MYALTKSTKAIRYAIAFFGITLSVVCFSSTAQAASATAPPYPAGSCVTKNDEGNAGAATDCAAVNVTPATRDDNGVTVNLTKNCYLVNAATTPPGVTQINCETGKDITIDPAINGGDCSTVEAGKCDLLDKYINPFINFLAAFVGIAVVASIIFGGIQYSNSAGDPQKTTMAKNRIRNAIVALITFVLLYAMLNFLIPGGLI